MPQQELTQPITVPKPQLVCESPDTNLLTHNNFPSTGYHGSMWKCLDGVEVSLAIWTGKDILFGFASQMCPDKRVEALDAENELADIREGRENISADVRVARRMLEEELARFRSQCGLPQVEVEGALEEMDSTLEEEVRRSWIQNRYGELRRGGPVDDSLLKQAQSDYEQLL